MGVKNKERKIADPVLQPSFRSATSQTIVNVKIATTIKKPQNKSSIQSLFSLNKQYSSTCDLIQQRYLTHR